MGNVRTDKTKGKEAVIKIYINLIAKQSIGGMRIALKQSKQ